MPTDGEAEVLTRGDHDINAFTMAGGRIAGGSLHDFDGYRILRNKPADGAMDRMSESTARSTA